MLTDPDEIRVLLCRLAAARSVVFAFVEGHPERCVTTVLGVDARLHALICDELIPPRGHARVRVGSVLRLTTRLDGAELRCRCTVRAIDRDGAIAAYRLDLPAALDHRERRRQRRLPVRGLRAQLRDAQDTGADARVVDLSLGGIRLAVAPPHALRVEQRWDCHLALPRGAFDAAIVIVRTRASRLRGGAREDDVGARFDALPAPAARRLGRYLADTERAQLRLRAERRA